MNELSFRARLTAFFVAIVVLPMIAVAVLAVRVTEDSRNARADATLEAATVLYEDSLAGVPGDAARIADSPGVTAALAGGDAGFLRRVARRELRDPDIVLLTFYSADGNELASAGNPDGLAASREPFDRGGEPAGEILLAALDPVEFADELAELTGDDVLIASGGRELAATTETAAAGPAVGAEGGAVDLGDEERRAAGTSLAGAPPGTWLVLITEHADAFVASAPLAAVALLAFFALALLLVWFALRVLRGQVGSMLDAARRIGAGDLSGRVPVQGDDEIAGLAREFNKMSDRLSAQMGEQQHQREEIDESVRRIGEAFASGLDRPATLEIVVETALTACEAERGRIVLSGEDGLVVSVGEAPEAGDGSLDVAIRLPAGPFVGSRRAGRDDGGCPSWPCVQRLRA